MLYAVAIPLLVLLSVSIDAEVYTSVEELEGLLEAQQRTINDMEMYVQYQEEILSNVKRYLNIFKREHERAMDDIPKYMENPINAFTLIKRLTADLSFINDTIRLGEKCINKTTMLHEDVKYPDPEDLIGAVQAIARLQIMYRLKASELSEGKLKGVTYSTPMTASDCYELGGRLFIKGDAKNAREWMFEAFKKYHEEKNEYYPFTDKDILYHINATSYYLEKENLTKAVVWVQKILDMVPEHPGAKEILEYYEKMLNTPKENITQNEESEMKKFNETDKETLKKHNKIFNNYEALCRDEMGIPPELSNRLTCRYLSENHPFSLIAPFKIEMMYLNPDVVLFHNIVSDKEIETLMKNAKPKFSRALVYKNGSAMSDVIRTSKVAWFEEKDCETVARITRRVHHMTGLSTNTADKLQVLNYGIGGQYEPHYDFSTNVPKNSTSAETLRKRGNRIATVLFYMSDVTQGGATVFPHLGLKVAPVKGTAILWYNLHASGNGDSATRHAACPVLLGSKWVFTKWLREFGQEFIRPCNLENQAMDHHRSKLLQPENRTMSSEPEIIPQAS